jgi:hypothetical protein
MDGSFILQDVSLRLRQDLQDLVLDVLQLLLVVGGLDDLSGILFNCFFIVTAPRHSGKRRLT